MGACNIENSIHSWQIFSQRQFPILIKGPLCAEEWGIGVTVNPTSAVVWPWTQGVVCHFRKDLQCPSWPRRLLLKKIYMLFHTFKQKIENRGRNALSPPYIITVNLAINLYVYMTLLLFIIAFVHFYKKYKYLNMYMQSFYWSLTGAFIYTIFR